MWMLVSFVVAANTPVFVPREFPTRDTCETELQRLARQQPERDFRCLRRGALDNIKVQVWDITKQR